RQRAAPADARLTCRQRSERASEDLERPAAGADRKAGDEDAGERNRRAGDEQRALAPPCAGTRAEKGDEEPDRRDPQPGSAMPRRLDPPTGAVGVAPDADERPHQRLIGPERRRQQHALGG